MQKVRIERQAPDQFPAAGDGSRVTETDLFTSFNPRCLRAGKIDIDISVPISPA